MNCKTTLPKAQSLHGRSFWGRLWSQDCKDPVMMGLSVHICWGISKIDVNFGYCVQKVLIKNLKLLIIIDYCEKKMSLFTLLRFKSFHKSFRWNRWDFAPRDWIRCGPCRALAVWTRSSRSFAFVKVGVGGWLGWLRQETKETMIGRPTGRPVDSEARLS